MTTGSVEAEVREVVAVLCVGERPSASDGERQVAEWVARRLADHGCEVTLEEEHAHGTYWWPMGLSCALGIAGGLAAVAGRRRLGALLGVAGAAALFDDVDSGLRPLRRLLPRRTTTNVLGWTGDRTAERVVVVMAHHDAPHTGLFFSLSDRFQHWLAARRPDLIESTESAVPVYWVIASGPLLAALGAAAGRRGMAVTGALLSAVGAAAFAQIGSSPVSPAANDDASGVAGLVAVARALDERPVSGVRVLLLSAGAEESFQEGIRGFARRHFPNLPTASTWVVNLETIGSPHLTLLEGEGPVVMRDYEPTFKERVSAVASREGIELGRGLRARTTTDSIVTGKAGYPTATLVSLDGAKALAHYHQLTDTPERLDYDTVLDAARLTEAVIRDLAES